VEHIFNEGPSVKKFITCSGCIHLKDATFTDFGNKPYKCFHDDIIKNSITSYDIMKGDINANKITPSYCPFLVKKLRLEKIKNLK